MRSTTEHSPPRPLPPVHWPATECTGPSWVVRELAVELLLNQAESVATALALQLHEHWREIAEEFLLEDDDKVLYEEAPYIPGAYPDSPGMADMSFEQWSVPLTDQTVNPYSVTGPEG